VIFFLLVSFAIWLGYLIYPFDCSIGQKTQTIPSKTSKLNYMGLCKKLTH